MSQSSRPGGLTAIAIVNFFFAALSLFGGCSVFVTPAFLNMLPEEAKRNMSEKDREQVQTAQRVLQNPTVRVLGVIDFVLGALLITSGIGYLKQKRVMGRYLGNITAVLSIAAVLFGYFYVSRSVETAASSFAELQMIFELIYPCLILFLLNMTFKEDFPN